MPIISEDVLAPLTRAEMSRKFVAQTGCALVYYLHYIYKMQVVDKENLYRVCSKIAKEVNSEHWEKLEHLGDPAVVLQALMCEKTKLQLDSHSAPSSLRTKVEEFFDWVSNEVVSCGHIHSGEVMQMMERLFFPDC